MDRAKFYEVLRGPATRVFGKLLSQQQVESIEGILDAMLEIGDGQNKTLSYALATAYHETGGRMVPVREGFASSDEGAVRAVHKLATRLGPNCAPSRYGKPTGPYGKTYYGRGHVQLTWLENYKRCSADAGVDLVQDPDAVLDARISARILILGLMDGRWNGKGKGLEHYLATGGAADLKNARRTVNGTDRWEEVAGYYEDFQAAVAAAGGCGATTCPGPQPKPNPSVIGKEADGRSLSAPLREWLAGCPGDIRAFGEWLTQMPRTPDPDTEKPG